MKRQFKSTVIIVLSILFMSGILSALTSCNHPTDDNPEEEDVDLAKPLTFIAKEDEVSLSYTVVGNLDTSKIKFSNDDGETWDAWDGTAILLNNGDSVCVKNENNSLSISVINYLTFSITDGKMDLAGNIMSMINYSSLSRFCFYSMFKDCDGIDDASKLLLPATTLAPHCYSGLFSNSSLSIIPLLPAATLASNCYDSMFAGCVALTSLPDRFNLPTTKLEESCYQYMFYDTNLSSLPSGFTLPATTLAESCYAQMFADCTNLKSLPNNFTLPATNLAPLCYQHMFGGLRNSCGLESLPNNFTLPATTLKYSCYDRMFYCDPLISLPDNFVIAATKLADEACYQMFAGCRNLIISNVLGTNGHKIFTCPNVGTYDEPTYKMFSCKKDCYYRDNDPTTGDICYYNPA